uniref:Integral membrane bound transporter domain-containing protein n=1 Tax=Chromera velia CCMP2878 TaxID=1169474 RepID=A0A0G4I1A2_9ALVE|eukprot:Cvel_10098.t1-p1 / transcript=Cvel_10098.t1 / gene=Cvel_10098 / organism=Chromera_velia_CCMP2878 / gene_product=Keratin-associated protein 5-10, putative / transcript_product=Keratin-associated protein 5-10, putative / location=Cvel_scaffold601:62884-68769(+) / protein_length=941 / sequence_SO=supercontig / SO=protein_coding / is_pseudo=false
MEERVSASEARGEPPPSAASSPPTPGERKGIRLGLGVGAENMQIAVQMGFLLSVAGLFSSVGAVKGFFDQFYRGSAIWVVVTMAMVAEKNMGASLQKCVFRIVGTVLGCSLASLTILLLQGVSVFFVTFNKGKGDDAKGKPEVLLSVVYAVCLFFVGSAVTVFRYRLASFQADYVFICAFFTTPLISASVFSEDWPWDLSTSLKPPLWRGCCILIGCLVSGMILCVFLPSTASHSLRSGVEKGMRDLTILASELTERLIEEAEVHGRCAGGVREVWGRCAESVREMCGRCAGGVREMCGRCAGDVRKVCRKCAGGVREVWGRCAESVLEMCGRCARGVREVWGRCAGGVRELCGKCAGVVREVCGSCAGSVREDSEHAEGGNSKASGAGSMLVDPEGRPSLQQCFVFADRKRKDLVIGLFGWMALFRTRLRASSSSSFEGGGETPNSRGRVQVPESQGRHGRVALGRRLSPEEEARIAKELWRIAFSISRESAAPPRDRETEIAEGARPYTSLRADEKERSRHKYGLGSFPLKDADRDTGAQTEGDIENGRPARDHADTQPSRGTIAKEEQTQDSGNESLFKTARVCTPLRLLLRDTRIKLLALLKALTDLAAERCVVNDVVPLQVSLVRSGSALTAFLDGDAPTHSDGRTLETIELHVEGEYDDNEVGGFYQRGLNDDTSRHTDQAYPPLSPAPGQSVRSLSCLRRGRTGLGDSQQRLQDLLQLSVEEGGGKGAGAQNEKRTQGGAEREAEEAEELLAAAKWMEELAEVAAVVCFLALRNALPAAEKERLSGACREARESGRRDHEDIRRASGSHYSGGPHSSSRGSGRPRVSSSSSSGGETGRDRLLSENSDKGKRGGTGEYRTPLQREGGAAERSSLSLPSGGRRRSDGGMGQAPEEEEGERGKREVGVRSSHDLHHRSHTHSFREHGLSRRCSLHMF